MANNQTNTARLLCSFFITVCLYTQNIKIKSTLQSTGKGVRQMWVRRFQLGWSLQAHDQWFPVGSCAALRRRRGAFWWGWGGRAKCQGSGRDGTGGSFGLRHKKNRWLEIGHTLLSCPWWLRKTPPSPRLCHPACRHHLRHFWSSLNSFHKRGVTGARRGWCTA